MEQLNKKHTEKQRQYSKETSRKFSLDKQNSLRNKANMLGHLRTYEFLQDTKTSVHAKERLNHDLQLVSCSMSESIYC